MLALANIRTYVVENAIGSLGKIITITCIIDDIGKLKSMWSAI